MTLRTQARLLVVRSTTKSGSIVSFMYVPRSSMLPLWNVSKAKAKPPAASFIPIRHSSSFNLCTTPHDMASTAHELTRQHCSGMERVTTVVGDDVSPALMQKPGCRMPQHDVVFVEQATVTSLLSCTPCKRHMNCTVGVDPSRRQQQAD